MKKSGRINWRQCNTSDTVIHIMSKPSGCRSRCKNKYNQCRRRGAVSEIKLKRTDTTLDLSLFVCLFVSTCLDVIVKGGERVLGRTNRQRELEKKRKRGRIEDERGFYRNSQSGLMLAAAWHVTSLVELEIRGRREFRYSGELVKKDIDIHRIS